MLSARPCLTSSPRRDGPLYRGYAAILRLLSASPPALARALRRAAPLAPAVTAVLFLASGPVLGASLDEEEYRNAVLSVVLHARALLDGVYPFWTTDLGFGLPHPLHPAFLLHPLMPLFAVLAPESAVRVVYAFHTVFGALGCWWLVRSMGVGPWIGGVAAATWTLATPSLNYAVTDFWPTEFITWSLAPCLLLTALRVLDAPSGAQPWGRAAAFGLTAGLMTANGHAGITPVFFVALAAVFTGEWPRTWRVWPALALAVCIGAAIAAPTLAQLLSEVRRFPPLPRITADRAVGWTELFDMVLRPLSFDERGMLDVVSARGARVPYFGGPMFLLALASVGLLRGAARRVGLLAGFVVSLLLMFATDLNRAGVLSGMYMFRDPMTVLGIVLGSLAWQAAAVRHRRLALAAGGLQLAVLFLAAWPFVSRAWATEGVALHYLRHTGSTAALGDWVERLPGRWYLAPELDERVRSGQLIIDGLWTDVWVYRGLPIVNGTFKGVSADPVYPSGTFPLGRIRGHPSTVASAATLVVLGVSAVLATATEPVAGELEEVARFPTRGGAVRLLRNPRAWPGASVVDARVLSLVPTPLPSCELRGALCLDLAPVAALAADTTVEVIRGHGALDLRVEAGRADRWLLVSEMYRRHWRATADGRELRVSPVLDALIGVQVPAGVSRIRLSYRPILLVVLTWISTLALLLTIAGLAAARRARRLRTGTAGSP